MKAFVVWWVVGFIVFGALSASWSAGIVAGLVVYLVAVQAYPWTICRRCYGYPRVRDPVDSRNWHDCPQCGGSGKQLRLLFLGRRAG